MMSLVKTGLAAIVAATLTIALAACGGGDEGSNADDNTLTVWAWDPNFNIYAMEEAEKIYAKDHPGFKLEVVETPWDDLQPKLTTIAQSQETDSLPDIFLVQNNAYQKNVLSYPDLFDDFSDTDIDLSQYPEAVVDYSTVDDINYGLPFDSGTAVTALRTDVLEEAGYTIDDFTDITWDDFIAKGKQVLAKTKKPLLSGQAGSSDIPTLILQSAGASLFDDDGNPTIVDNAELRTAVDIYAELVKSGIFVEVNSWDQYIGSFVNGDVAGTMNGVWILGSVQSAEDQAGKWAVTNLPKLDGVDGATNYSANGGSSWAISSNADKELAADFLAETFAGSTELYDTILPSSGAIATWTPAGESTVYTEPQEFFGGDPVYAKVIDFSTKVPSNNTGAYYYEGRDAVSAAMTKIINGSDPDAALKEAQEKVEFAMK